MFPLASPGFHNVSSNHIILHVTVPEIHIRFCPLTFLLMSSDYLLKIPDTDQIRILSPYQNYL